MNRPHPYFEARQVEHLDAPVKAPIRVRHRSPWWSRYGELMMWLLGAVVVGGYLGVLFGAAVL